MPYSIFPGMSQGKLDLLADALAGKSKPLPQTSAYQKLRYYAYDRRYKHHDPKFEALMRFVAPLWFDFRFRSRDDELLQELMAIARSGQPRPRSIATDEKERRLGVALLNYTRKGSPAYRPAFSTEVRKLRPEWFKKRRLEVWKQKNAELLRVLD